MPVIELYKLSKTYRNGKVKAVNEVSFDVEKAEVFGLIGPDGAGKTSIFRMLTTLLLPSGGSASVSGLDIVKDFRKIRALAGYMPGKFSLYRDLTVEENLDFFATIFGTTVKESYGLIKDIYGQLEPFKKRRADALSGGMKQKLALCCALIHKPEVLFLDEPTTGVDAVSRREFWEMLNRLKKQGITILVSTAYMDEATLCDRIALILDGNILSIDTPANIIKRFPAKLFSIKAENSHRLLADMQHFSKSLDSYPFGDSVHVVFEKGQEDTSDLKEWLRSKGYQDVQVKEEEPTIEDCFIKLLKA